LWTNRQKLRTPGQLSSTSRDIYYLYAMLTHLPKGVNHGKA
jgi:hypothetical protein